MTAHERSSMPHTPCTGSLVVATGLLLAFGFGIVDASEPSEDPRPGQLTLTLTSGGLERSAELVIPPAYSTAQKPPLVILLHGAGGSGAIALEKDGWAKKANQEGFLVVAPDGLPTRVRQEANFRTNPRVWNSGQLRPISPRAMVNDVAFINQLLDELKTKAPYDEQRVYCVGHSNGGGMTFRLAAELSERFAAVGTVAGQMVLDNPQPKKPVPMLYLIGTEDPLLPLAGGEIDSPWGKRTNPPVEVFLGRWAVAIGCQDQAKTLSDEPGLKTVEYPSKTNGPTLKVMYLKGHGHQWPGATPRLRQTMGGPVNTKVNATDTLWKFFVEVSLREA